MRTSFKNTKNLIFKKKKKHNIQPPEHLEPSRVYNSTKKEHKTTPCTITNIIGKINIKSYKKKNKNTCIPTVFEIVQENVIFTCIEKTHSFIHKTTSILGTCQRIQKGHFQSGFFFFCFHWLKSGKNSGKIVVYICIVCLDIEAKKLQWILIIKRKIFSELTTSENIF